VLSLLPYPITEEVKAEHGIAEVFATRCSLPDQRTDIFIRVIQLDQFLFGRLSKLVSLGKDQLDVPVRTFFVLMEEVYDARSGDPAHMIEVGEGFLAKYPMSVYVGAVYSELASAYLNTNQADKMVTAGTKAVEINPDNVDVLPLLAWAIPRRVTGQTADAAQQLSKAQDYAKHGIQLLTTMPKPEEMDDAAFTKAKNEKLAMCHDGIGVAEVKTGKYDDAITELNQSVELSATPDPVDFYLLGVANQLTSHFTDAIASFTKCSTAGPLQAQCKAGLDDVKKKSQNSLEAPK